MTTRPIPYLAARGARLFVPLLLAVATTACGDGQRAGGGADADAGGGTTATSMVTGGAQQVEAKIGDATVHVVALQTSTIPDEVAREQDIPRANDLLMLRISGRRGAGDVTSVPLQVEATAAALNGTPQPLPVRAVEANGLTDYVATFRTTLPNTVRFDIRVKTPEGASQTLQLVHDVR